MADPRDEAFDAYERFAETCESLADESPALRLRREADAFETLADDLASCYVDGLSSVPVGQFASMVSDVSSSLNKTEAKQHIVSKTQDLKTKGNDRPQITEWIQENLREVRVVRTTDHVDVTRYVWDFGATTLETESGDEGRTHYHWQNFRDTIYDAGGPYCTPPPEQLREIEDWREWIVTRLEEHKTEKTTMGPRTLAVNELQNRVRRAEAHGKLLSALNYQGVYLELDGDPPEETITDISEYDPTAMYLPNNWATEAAEEHGVSTQALQNELDARGYLLPGRSKVATQEYVGGQYTTWWVLTGEFAQPASYDPSELSASHTVNTPGESDTPDDDFEGGMIGGDEQ